MSNPHRALAEMHKFSINPADPRSLDELERYYRNLSHGSPFARACSELIAEDTAQNAQEFAELATKAAITRATEDAAFEAEAMRYAEEQARIWGRLPADEKWEQIDIHMESSFPEMDDDLREAMVDRACRG